MAEIKKGAKADEPPVVAQLRGEIVLLKRVPASKAGVVLDPSPSLDSTAGSSTAGSNHHQLSNVRKH